MLVRLPTPDRRRPSRLLRQGRHEESHPIKPEVVHPHSRTSNVSTASEFTGHSLSKGCPWIHS